QALPVDAERQPVQVVVVAVASLADATQHAAGEPRPQVRAIGDLAVAVEEHAAGDGAAAVRTQSAKLGGCRGFESARAGGEQVVDGGVQNGLTTTRDRK